MKKRYFYIVWMSLLSLGHASFVKEEESSEIKYSTNKEIYERICALEKRTFYSKENLKPGIHINLPENSKGVIIFPNE